MGFCRIRWFSRGSRRLGGEGGEAVGRWLSSNEIVREFLRLRWCVWGSALLWGSWFAAGLAVGAVGQTGLGVGAVVAGTELRGRTLDAVSGLPLARVLVQTDGGAVLSDHDGGFVLPVAGAGPVRLRVKKPGYSVGPEEMEGDAVFLPAGVTVADVRLFPEAMVSGVVSDPEGQPVGKVVVHVYRSEFDERGHSWVGAGQSRTDVHGEFRIGVPAGTYVVGTEYMPRVGGRQEALLPVVLPAGSSGNGLGALRLGSGQEQRVDLHPAMRGTFVQKLTVEGMPAGFYPELTASLANGTAFAVRMRPTPDAGVFAVDLPAGSYVLRSESRGRDGAATAEARLTVPSDDLSAVALRFVSSARIPLEVAVDPAGEATGGVVVGNVTAQQLNLTLWRVDGGLPAGGGGGRRGGGDGEVRLTDGGGGGGVFAAAPGVYRLRSGSGGAGYAESATMGGSDLMSHELTVGVGGAASAPIRVVVGRSMGLVRGQIRSAAMLANLPVYLIASEPSLHPVTVLASSVDGSFASSLPPGSYRAVAFEHRHSLDLESGAVLDSLKGRVGSFSVVAGETATVDLTPVLDAEVHP